MEMFGPGKSTRFPEAGSWWRHSAAPEATESPWDVAEIAAWQKHLEKDMELSPLEGEAKEPLHVEDPVGSGCRRCLVPLGCLDASAVQELEAIKAKVREMERKDEWLQQLQSEAKSLLLRSEAALPLPRMAAEKIETDQRSIYVGNVDYGGTAEELESHFNICGEINRLTILCDKFSGHPKGYAYIEFADRSSIKAALELDKSMFRGRALKVLPKRTNMPGISSTDRGGSQARSRGLGTRPRQASVCHGRQSNPRGRVYRSRGRISPWYMPY